MACIKETSRSASVAFAPDAPYLAVGTMAGGVDLSFSSSANLELFKLDFQSNDRELPIVGECPSSERFNRISWGRTASVTEELYRGLIAGGLVDGSINIWNPLTLIHSKDIDGALVQHLQKHARPIRGLEFNNNSSKMLLASGAEEGELYIWDLKNPTDPTRYPPIKVLDRVPKVKCLSFYGIARFHIYWRQPLTMECQHENVGYMLSCYDADLSSESCTNTFHVRYPPHGRQMVFIEEGVKWERLRAPPVHTPAHELHLLDCLDDL